MKLLRSTALVAVAAAAIATPAIAQNRPAAAAAPAITGTTVPGLAVANLEGALVNSDAFRVAQQQRPVTYKAQYDQAQARSNALEAQMKPMIDRFNASRAAATTPALQQALQGQARAIQELQERGKNEIQQILLPVALSEAYVNEQLGDKLDAAVTAAMNKARVTILLQPGAVVARANSYDITMDIARELNATIPTAQLVPPAGWEPRQIREARAAQAAQGAPAARPGTPAPAAPRPATPQPEGR
jgi:Skp family chaperone for outer membrane proteins